LSAEIQLNLFESVQIHPQTPMCKIKQITLNNHNVLNKGKKKIETLFSQMCDQFTIRENFAKFLWDSKQEFF
jgi:hypothetical protein